MGLLDFLKDKLPQKEAELKTVSKGVVEINNVKFLGSAEIEDMQNGFIAIDFETTGLSPVANEIVEYAAVVFQNGKITNSFSELAKPTYSMPSNATKVNGITDKMLKKAAPTQDVAKKLYEFIKQYEGYPFVAHNAPFDMKFLIQAWTPLGISVKINVIDTLDLARQMRPKQPSYHLAAVARMFNIETGETHRAKADAELCGKIAVKILAEKKFLIQEKKNTLTDFELRIAQNIKTILEEADRNIAFLSFSQGAYLNANNYYNFVKIKCKAKKPYILVSEECANSLPSERVNECPATEAKDNQKRFMIETPDDIFEIKAFLLESFDGAQKSLTELWDFGERYQKSVVEHLANGIVI